jgi:hypothetical protein
MRKVNQITKKLIQEELADQKELFDSIMHVNINMRTELKKELGSAYGIATTGLHILHSRTQERIARLQKRLY